VFQNKSSECKSKIRFASDEVQVVDTQWLHGKEPLLTVHFKLGELDYHLNTPMSGAYQVKNLAGVIMVVDELKTMGYSITTAHLTAGVNHVKRNTGLRGRWEKLGSTPSVYCDTGHNEAGVSEVLEMIRRTSHQKLHLVWGMVNDKDIRKILSMLPQNAQYYFCNASIPRAMPAKQLQQEAAIFSLSGLAFESVRQAVSAAKRQAGRHDLIVIGGSTFVVAEI
jgi:dihydrofolate synthase/folylpolyglutamate synthase